MGNKSNFMKLLEMLQCLIEDENDEVTVEERNLLNDLIDEVKSDRKIKILGNRFYQDNAIVLLLENIDKEISKCKDLMEKNKIRHLSKSWTQFHASDEELEYMIDMLIDLKERINKYLDPQCCREAIKRQRLEDKCVRVINKGCYLNTYFFGQGLFECDNLNDISDVKVNDEVVENVFSVLEDDVLMKKLRRMSDTITKLIAARRDVRDYEDALYFKEIIFNNSDQIVTYNRIIENILVLDQKIKRLDNKKYDIELDLVEKQIGRLSRDKIGKKIRKNKLDKLEERRKVLRAFVHENLEAKKKKAILMDELISIRDDLCLSNLGRIIYESETRELPFIKDTDGKDSLANVFSSFYDKEEIEKYYARIPREYKSAKGRYEKLMRKKDMYDRDISLEYKNFINGDYVTIQNIVELSRSGSVGNISPVIALFILRVIGEMKKINYADFEISSDEENLLNEYYDHIISYSVGEFEEEFLDIMDCKSKKYV